MFAILVGKASNYFRSEIFKMAHCELDSFVLKFKNLWQAGRNANLSIKSNGGKVEVHLSVELGDAPFVTSHGHIPRSKNGPSRQRRRERRAAAHAGTRAAEQANIDQDTAVEASNGSTGSEILSTVNIVYATENGGNEQSKVIKEAKDKTEDSNLEDEFCSDHIYLDNVVNDETLLEEILLTPTCQEGWNDEDVENLLDYNLKLLEINMVKAKSNRSNTLTSCQVIIQPIPKKNIEGLSFPLRSWTLKTCHR
jgi:hypothetical protein